MHLTFVCFALFECDLGITQVSLNPSRRMKALDVSVFIFCPSAVCLSKGVQPSSLIYTWGLCVCVFFTAAWKHKRVCFFGVFTRRAFRQRYLHILSILAAATSNAPRIAQISKSQFACTQSARIYASLCVCMIFNNFLMHACC